MLERNGSFFNFFGLLPIFELYHYNTICLKPEPFLFSDRVFFTASISKSSISCLGWHFFALGRRKIIVIVKERRIKESNQVRNLNLGRPRRGSFFLLLSFSCSQVVMKKLSNDTFFRSKRERMGKKIVI